jgi:hypothetical protein
MAPSWLVGFDLAFPLPTSLLFKLTPIHLDLAFATLERTWVVRLEFLHLSALHVHGIHALAAQGWNLETGAVRP